MNAMPDVAQSRSITWPAQDTGLQAYGRVLNERRNAIAVREPQKSPFDDIDRRVSEEVAKQQNALREIKKSFVFRDDDVVAEFLRSHRTVPQLLQEARSQLVKFFGQDAVFGLKVLTEEDGSRELYIVAEWSGPAREAMNALDRFIDGWWIEQSGPAASRVNVTYELT